jgi:hypothetical protein
MPRSDSDSHKPIYWSIGVLFTIAALVIGAVGTTYRGQSDLQVKCAVNEADRANVKDILIELKTGMKEITKSQSEMNASLQRVLAKQEYRGTVLPAPPPAYSK